MSRKTRPEKANKARRAREEQDPEVLEIMAGAPECVDWVRHEFAGVDLGDKRLNKRLIRTVQHLVRSPLSPINEACGTWAETAAAYRLLANERATPEAIMAPHLRATARRIEEADGYTLLLQDTSYLSFGHHPKTQGIGPIGDEDKGRGICMHTALAVRPSGVALGVASVNMWTRGEVPDETPVEKATRLQNLPIEEKESMKWLKAWREAMARIKPAKRSKVITVADREADIWEFVTDVKNSPGHFVVRAKYEDRRLVPEESEGCEEILDALAVAPVLGGMLLNIPGNGDRKARVAKVEIRATQITLKAPQRRGRAKDSPSYSDEPISVYVVQATEIAPPEGETPASWVLLTDFVVKDLTGAIGIIDWYTTRWTIETWHKTLKSGCAVEDCRLETAERLIRYVSIFGIIACRLMHVAYLARDLPDLPATDVFSKEQIEALHIRLKKEMLPPAAKSPSLREIVRMIGGLGGHLLRKCDGEPGLTVIWRGWMRMNEDLIMLNAHREALAR